MFNPFDFLVSHPILALILVVGAVFLFGWLESGGLMQAQGSLIESMTSSVEGGLNGQLAKLSNARG